ncbi:hypothetical protein LTR08_005903 [Meristemomyces frigidus]|nr:hypothetical protein LTR08_005903 [Meristemomyces frigidus]
MPLTLSRMTLADIPAFAVVDAAAMADWGMARLMDSPSEPRQQMVERWTRAGFRNDDEQAWVIVRDDETGDMVAAAMWQFVPEQVPEMKEGVEGKVEAAALMESKEMGEREKILSREGGMAALVRSGKAFKNEFIGGKAHAYLNILVTHPAHQRKGAGSMLVKWGCDKADEKGVMSALMASAAGQKVYQNHGFKVVFEKPFDLRPYGIDETELRRGMIRAAKAEGL